MLINHYCTGFVAIPTVLSLRKHGVFDVFFEGASISFSSLTHQFNLNQGHFSVALNLLVSMGWFTVESLGNYQMGLSKATISKIPDSLVTVYSRSQTVNHTVYSSLQWFTDIENRWSLSDDRVADYLDGVVLLPFLLSLRSMFRQNPKTSRWDHVLDIPDSLSKDVFTLFKVKGWVNSETRVLTALGRQLLDVIWRAAIIGSYQPMLSDMDTLLFGDCQSVFNRMPLGFEGHVDRTLNVLGSGIQHDVYFNQLIESALSLFDSDDFDEQPRYIMDIGCGDGTLLRRVYDRVLTKTKRGHVLDKYPLTLVGVDYNQEALAEARKTLDGYPYIVVQGDVSRPDVFMDMIDDTDSDRTLYLHSFIDHNRMFIKPDQEACFLPMQLSGVQPCVSSTGDIISESVILCNLRDHLKRWAKIVGRAGITLLEVHGLSTSVKRQVGNESIAISFDAIHGFSSQFLVDAFQFNMSASESGLFPKYLSAQFYPVATSYTRITLNHYEKKPYHIRYLRLSDVPHCLTLVSDGVPESLRLDKSVLRERLLSNPRWCMVLCEQEKVIGVIYAQSIPKNTDLTSLRFNHLLDSQDKEGTLLQILGIHTSSSELVPDAASVLLNHLLYQAVLDPKIVDVIGVSSCQAYKSVVSLPYERYIEFQDKDGFSIDSNLRFHQLHGATIETCIPNYRPEDLENEGYGVLIKYRLGRKDIFCRQRRLNSDADRRVVDSDSSGAQGYRLWLSWLLMMELYSILSVLSGKSIDQSHLDVTLNALSNRETFLDDLTCYLGYLPKEALDGSTTVATLIKAFQSCSSIEDNDFFGTFSSFVSRSCPYSHGVMSLFLSSLTRILGAFLVQDYHVSFIDLGVDSIVARRLASDMNTMLSLSLSEIDIYTYETPKELSAYVIEELIRKDLFMLDTKGRSTVAIDDILGPLKACFPETCVISLSDSTFVEMGLTSLQILQVIDRINKQFMLNLEPIVCHDYPTFNRLSTYVCLCLNQKVLV